MKVVGELYLQTNLEPLFGNHQQETLRVRTPRPATENRSQNFHEKYPPPPQKKPGPQILDPHNKLWTWAVNEFPSFYGSFIVGIQPRSPDKKK